MSFWNRTKASSNGEREDERVDNELQRFFAERDDLLYRPNFGLPHRGAIATITPELINGILPSFEPAWLHAGVYVFEPSQSVRCWTFVTAGLSTPWQAKELPDLNHDCPDPRLGLGFELLIRMREFDDWAIRLLNRLMVYQLGTSQGLIPGRIIEAYQRIPLRGLGCLLPNSSVDAVAVVPPVDIPAEYLTSKGRIRLLQLFGITREEYAWSIKHGVEALIEKVSGDRMLVTSPERVSIDAAVGEAIPEELAKHFVKRTSL